MQCRNWKTTHRSPIDGFSAHVQLGLREGRLSVRVRGLSLPLASHDGEMSSDYINEDIAG